VVRNAGNVTTPEVIASLDTDVVLGAAVLVVVGHSACGAVKATIAADAVPGQISSLYQHIMPCGRPRTGGSRRGHQGQRFDPERTLSQASTVIAGLVRDGKLAVRGIVYDIKVRPHHARGA
jgi:carbonic anhydrase